MGRLDDILARNRRRQRPGERALWSMVFGLIILLILGLAVFTDLGRPPASSAPPRGPHVDGVLLRSVPARAH